MNFDKEQRRRPIRKPVGFGDQAQCRSTEGTIELAEQAPRASAKP